MNDSGLNKIKSMSQFQVAVLGTAGVLILSASAAFYGHFKNERIEKQRLEVFSESAAGLISGEKERGEIVARAGGCVACHTDTGNGGKPLAGGVEIASPFGTFVSPNISSDATYGIGSWSEAMLASALLNGRRPDGGHYWPAFPYPAFSAMTSQDISDLFLWLQSSAPVSQASREHDLLIPDIARVTMGIWKSLYVPDDYSPNAFQERGEYLVEALAHCAVCHSQRNLIGGVSDRAPTGNSRGPSGSTVPAITADALEDWTHDDLVFYLEAGMTPNGDFSGGHMAKVIEHGTAHLPLTDLQAMAAYLKSSNNIAERY